MNGQIKTSLFITLTALLFTLTPHAQETESPLDKRIDGPVIARNQDLQTILSLVHTETGIQFVLDEGVHNKVTFNLESPTARVLLDTVLPSVGLAYKDIGNNIYRIGTLESLKKHKAKIEENPASKPIEESATGNPLGKRIDGPVIARGQDLQTILSLLQSESGVQMVLDAGIDHKVTFSMESPTVGDVLNTILPANGLAYKDIGNNVYRIGTPESLRKPQKPFPTFDDNEFSPTVERALNKTINGPVIARNQDIETIFVLLQDQSKIPFSWEHTTDKKVTFNLESPTIRQVLNAALTSAGLVCVETDEGVLRIGDPESMRKYTPEGRAEAIRKSMTVMSNVLDYMLKQRLGDGYQSRGLFSKGTRGYWIPKSGLLFVLGVKFPLIAPEDRASAINGNGEKDLWERFEDNLNAGVSDPTRKEFIELKNDAPASIRETGFNAQKIETMRSTVLEALAKYGCRFEGFKDDETITVIVESESGSAADLFTSTPGVATAVQAEGQKGPFQEFRELFSIEDKFDSVKAEERISALNAEMDAAMQILDTHRADLAASKLEIEIAQNNLEMVQKRFEAGTAPNNDVLGAKKETIVAQKSLNEAERKIVESERKLKLLQTEKERLEKKLKQTIERAPISEKTYTEESSIADQPPRGSQTSVNTIVTEEKVYEEAAPENFTKKYGPPGVASNKTIEETVTNYQYPWTRVSNEAAPVMIIQIKFGDLPPFEGTVDEIQDKVTVTTY